MANIHPSAIVDKTAVLGDDVVIGPHCEVGPEVRLGEGTRLISNVVIGPKVTFGKGNTVHPYSVIGGMPQILGWDESANYGSLVIADDNTIREHVTLHCSMVPDKVTRVGSHNLIMVGAHVGHDCQLGDHLVISNACQLSGHCKLEDGVWLSGMVGLHQFVTIHKWVFAAAMSAITHDVPPYLVVSGNYPMRVRGVNTRGVRRAGLDNTVEESINAAYRRLYRQGDTLLENVRLMAAENDMDEHVRAIVTAIEKSSQHRFGRYLETFR